MKRLSALCGFAMGALSLMAVNEVETRAFYSTNPSDAVGKAASIAIDGEFSDWSEDMIVATCGANDVATAFKGSHENCVLDLYAVYASWDDNNLYIAWQMCNTGDTWARPGDGPLTDGGRIGNVPIIVALSVDPGSVGLSGKVKDGRHIWGKSECGVEFASHIDHLFIMSGQGLDVNAGAAMFTAIDGLGDTEYDNPACCKSFKSLGIDYKFKYGFQPSHLWRQNTYADYDAGGKLLSDPAIVDNVFDPECYDNLLSMPYPSSLKPHDTKFDTFYEMNIPLSALGITRQWLEANGVGVRVIATRGESGIDCCPFDPSMLDNVFGSYSADKSTSHEKDDIDVISYALASVAKVRTGSVDPIPDPEPDPTPGPTPDPTPADGNYTVYFDNTSSAWDIVKTWIWDAAHGNENYTGGVWPGADMDIDAVSGYYKYTFKCDVPDADLMVLFNSGNGGTQTGDHKLVNNGVYTKDGFKQQYAAISDITDDGDAGSVWYNLQGVPVSEPGGPGVYIRRTSGRAAKIIVR